MRQSNIIIIYFLLASIDFFSCIPLMQVIDLSILKQVCSFAMIIFVLYKFKDIVNAGFKTEVALIGISAIASAISSYLLYEQSFYMSIKVVCPLILSYFLYLYMSYSKIDEELLINMIIAISVFFTFAEIIQQFTYPTYWFAGREVREDTGNLEQRMGFWRFYIYGINYCMLAFFLVYQKMLGADFSKKNLFLIIVLVFGIFFFLARKNIYAIIGTSLLGILISRRKIGFGYKLILLGLVSLAIIVLLPYMVELNEKTSNEINNEDFIRYISADYFLNSFSDSNLYKLFGAGCSVSSGPSRLSHEISRLMDLGICQDDCGFVGYYSRFGAFGLFTMILILIKILINHKKIDVGLLLFSLVQIEICFFDFWGNTIRSVIVMAPLLYLIDCSIRRYNLKKMN